jgi:2-keto-3-deoxy-L-rhamnonate aldolase RhmA
MDIVNHAKRRLENGQLAIGFGVRMVRTVEGARIAKTAGYDWLFIDMEHGPFDVDAAGQIAVAALAEGITPIARVPGFEHYHASRLLDAGALGIVVPHVDTAKQAKQVVDNCRFPPLGRRSFPGALPQLGFAPTAAADTARLINDGTLVVVMLETPKAIANADAIAAVDGVDVLLIGTNDLTIEMGIPGQHSHPKVVDAYRKMIAACRKHGKHAGMGGIYDPPIMRNYVDMGVRFLLGGADLAMLMGAAKQRADVLRGLEPDARRPRATAGAPRRRRR